ncbi:VOC family protein [Actinomycetospora flava]|uniref:VOC family protein n=1 Tax=Actinomycetospora flava TaxID=3129232 RepID=A0ABU8M5E6_9PSEU
MSTSLAMINLDGPDPRAQAAFYGTLLGWETVHAEDEYAMISSDGAPIGFGRVPGWTAPPWPDPEGVKRYHLDLAVDDLDAAVARARELGATVPEHQPGQTWTVLIDPVGHPFCLCPRR